MTSDAVENLDPRSVVNFMIEYGKVRDYKLKNVSLQKLLYFCHAAYLVRHGKPLVSGYFEAWEYGPVHRTVYDALRQYGRQEVTKPIDRRDPFTGQVSVISPPHNIVVTDHVEQTMRTLGRIAPGHLIALSHAADGPWHYVWNKSKLEPVLGNRITDKITLERFARLKASLTFEPLFGDTDEASPLTGD